MALLNDNYLKLKAGYLFPEIGRRVKAFCDAHPDAAKRLIRCGIGDVTEPLPPAVVTAMHPHQSQPDCAGARPCKNTACQTVVCSQSNCVYHDRIVKNPRKPDEEE